jgi:hypothetical protein
MSARGEWDWKLVVERPDIEIVYAVAPVDEVERCSLAQRHAGDPLGIGSVSGMASEE